MVRLFAQVSVDRRAGGRMFRSPSLPSISNSTRRDTLPAP
jgi:hypothetical protein